MMTLQPLSSMADARFRPAEHFGFAARLSWIPVNDTEFHLTAHHLPLSVRLLGGMPRLGAIVHPAFLSRPAVDGEGRWRVAYRPLALRTYPFVLANRAAARPIDGIDLVAESGLVGPWGMPVCADPGAGTLSPEMEAVRNTLLMMRTGAVRMSAALELLRISNVLVPLREPGDRPAADLAVDAARFGALDEGAVSALAGRSFLPLDLAGAILFSRRHLHPDRLPLAEPQRAASPEAALAPAGNDIVLANLAAMNFALDASTLFDLGEVADWTEFAAPLPPADDAGPKAAAA